MAKIIIEIPDGDYCYIMNNTDDECEFWNGDFDRCEIFHKRVDIEFKNNREYYVILKCKECLEQSK